MSNVQEIVISTPLRTAIGTFGGTLRDIPASDLGATVLEASEKRRTCETVS